METVFLGETTLQNAWNRLDTIRIELMNSMEDVTDDVTGLFEDIDENSDISQLETVGYQLSLMLDSLRYCALWHLERAQRIHRHLKALQNSKDKTS